MAKSSRSGANSFRLYEPSSRKDSLRRQNISMADQIISALDDDRILVAYQPIVCAQTGETVFYECLARMTLPDGNMLMAMDWIPIAERLGLIRQIDRRVAEIAVGVLSVVPDLSLALNVSALTASDGEWIRSFLNLIGKAPQAASRLTVELTETLALRDLEEIEPLHQPPARGGMPGCHRRFRRRLYFVQESAAAQHRSRQDRWLLRPKPER